jgi:hypothetical protein
MAKKPNKSAIQQQRERIYKGLRSWLMPPDFQPYVSKIPVVPSKYRVARARQIHARLAVARFGADPRLV